MKKQYLLGIFTLISFTWDANAQTVVTPQSITATVNPFSSSSTPLSNLTLNVNSSVNSNTTFSFSPTSNFSTGIGFISSLGKDTGTITYTYTNPVSISQMMIWNAYFVSELNHSTKTIDLIFRNNSGTIINTIPLSIPQATSGDLKPYVANLASEVLGVKSVSIKFKTLWGGNEISLRRIAFAGTGQTASLDEYNSENSIQVFPNPSTNEITISEKEIQSVQMFDLNGKNIAIELVKYNDYSKVYWQNITPGMYRLQITTPNGQFFSKVIVN